MMYEKDQLMAEIDCSHAHVASRETVMCLHCDILISRCNKYKHVCVKM